MGGTADRAQEAADDVAHAPGALVTFNEPVAPRGRPGEAPAPDLAGATARRNTVLVIARVFLASAYVGFAPLFTDAETTWYSVVVALVYLPVVCTAPTLFGGRGWLVPVLLGFDVALIASFHVVAGAPELLLAAPLWVALHTWAHGNRAGAAATAGIAMVLGGLLATDTGGINAWHLGATIVVGIAMVVVVEDQAGSERVATTGFRLASEKAEAVLAGIADAVVTTSRAGIVHAINPAAVEVLGCHHPDQAGRSCNDLLALKDGNRTLDCSSGCAILAMTDEHQVELQRIGPNGQRQPLLASARPLVDEAGRVVEIVHSFRDITAVKAADEAKTLFLATTSHELKTPLTVIRGFAQMLQKADLPADRRAEAARVLEARAAELATIVERLLMTSRIEAGHVDLSPTVARIDDLIEHRAREVAAASARAITTDIAQDLPPVWVDPDGLATALDHLLENAVKYSPDGGEIHLQAVNDGDEVVLSCTDVGVGMTASQQARCFERFWQAEGTDVRRFGGTGIGLYIVRSLVEAMDATIEVESQAGQGTTFRIRLRLGPPLPPSAPPELEESAPAPTRGEESFIDEIVRHVGAPSDDRQTTR